MLAFADLARPAERRVAFAYDLVLIAAGSVLVALAAQVAVPLPFTPVPWTLQPLAVLLVGALLGARRGAAALVAYLAEGASGMPVFAGRLPARIAAPATALTSTIAPVSRPAALATRLLRLRRRRPETTGITAVVAVMFSVGPSSDVTRASVAASSFDGMRIGLGCWLISSATLIDPARACLRPVVAGRCTGLVLRTVRGHQKTYRGHA